jgi:hypothetical protein
MDPTIDHLNLRPVCDDASSGGIKRPFGWLGRLFSCWHREMGWPFTIEGQTYRVCLHCGAQRQFRTDSWMTVGQSYFSESAPKPLKPAPISFRERVDKIQPRPLRQTQGLYAALRRLPSLFL